jgi:hypothetical protein
MSDRLLVKHGFKIRGGSWVAPAAFLALCGCLTDRIELFSTPLQVDMLADERDAEVDQMIPSNEANDTENPEAIDGAHPDAGEVGADRCTADADCQTSDDP